jgi:hypothetical protein
MILITISCDKNRNSEVLYNGTVDGIDSGCVLPPSEHPYIIKFDDVAELEENHPIRIYPHLDSSLITIIPNNYKVLGKKIQFGFRKRNADEEFTCFGGAYYYQAVITEINANL